MLSLFGKKYDAAVEITSASPKQVTTEAPVGKSHLAEKKSPSTLTKNPILQPMISLCNVPLAISIAQVAGTTR